MSAESATFGSDGAPDVPATYGPWKPRPGDIAGQVEACGLWRLPIPGLKKVKGEGGANAGEQDEVKALRKALQRRNVRQRDQVHEALICRLPVRVRWRLAWAAARAAARVNTTSYQLVEVSHALFLVSLHFMDARDLLMRSNLADLLVQLRELPDPSLLTLRYLLAVALDEFDRAPPYLKDQTLRQSVQQLKASPLCTGGVRRALLSTESVRQALLTRDKAPTQGATP